MSDSLHPTNFIRSKVMNIKSYCIKKAFPVTKQSGYFFQHSNITILFTIDFNVFNLVMMKAVEPTTMFSKESIWP